MVGKRIQSSTNAVYLCTLQKEEQMALGQQHSTGKYYNYQDAEQVPDLNPVSLPTVTSGAANAEYKVQVDALTEPRVDVAAPRGAITGSMICAICGCLAGLGILAVPGVGPVVAVGTTATALIMTLAGTGIGVACGGLVDALFMETAID